MLFAETAEAPTGFALFSVGKGGYRCACFKGIGGGRCCGCKCAVTFRKDRARRELFAAYKQEQYAKDLGIFVSSVLFTFLYSRQFFITNKPGVEKQVYLFLSVNTLIVSLSKGFVVIPQWLK